MLGSAAGCQLKFISASTENREKFEELPRDPAAVLGTSFHKAMETCVTDGTEAAIEAFELAILTPIPGSDPPFTLSDAIEKKTIRKLYRRLAATQALGSQGLAKSTPTGLRGPPESLRFGAELRLESATLRLRGSADLIAEEPDGTVTITDYKTGGVTDREGKIWESYRLQLFAYALMYIERFGPAEIELRLDNGRVHPIHCTERDLQEARRTITEIGLRLPPHDTVNITELAEPGTDCRNCSIRSNCVVYLSVAPTWWPDVPPDVGPLALDTWGVVEQVMLMNDKYMLSMEDDAGRKVRVEQTAKHPGFGADLIGQRLWFFGLASDVWGQSLQGKRPHPRFFHELSRGPGDSRAWSAAVYRRSD